ncbi:MAG: hypothetical protein CMN78_01335 [Spirochaetales bacterium]|nr:hypothetical protein [Spirochaetales bacterium]
MPGGCRQLVLLLPVVFFMAPACSQQSKIKSFASHIERIDGALALGSLDGAARELEIASRSVRSRSSWLSIIKRAYSIDAARENHELAYQYASKAIEKFPDAEEIAALYAFAAVRSGRLAKALLASQKRLGANWQSLSEEIIVRKLLIDRESSDMQDPESLLLLVIDRTDPTLLRQAADRFHDSRFLLDAALLFAMNGQIEMAAEMLDAVQKQFTEASLFLSYDSSRYEAALRATHLLRAPRADPSGLMPLIADIYYRLDDFVLAENTLVELLSTGNAAARDHANLIWLYLAAERFDEAEAVLVDALPRFPDAKSLKVKEIEYLIMTRNESLAVEKLAEVLAIYQESFIDDLELATYSFLLYPGTPTRLRLRSILWQSFLSRPTDTQRASKLAGYLLANDDFADLERLVQLWEKHNGPTEWSLFIDGILAISTMNILAARTRFESAYGIERRWQSAYNIGILHFADGRFDSSIDFMRQAEALLPETAVSYQQRKALIRAKLGEILYHAGRPGAATREAQYALELNPELDEAHLLLKMLESKQE